MEAHPPVHEGPNGSGTTAIDAEQKYRALKAKTGRKRKQKGNGTLTRDS